MSKDAVEGTKNTLSFPTEFVYRRPNHETGNDEKQNNVCEYKKHVSRLGSKVHANPLGTRLGGLNSFSFVVLCRGNMHYPTAHTA